MLTRGLGMWGLVTGGMGAYVKAAPPGPPPGPVFGPCVAGIGRYVREELAGGLTPEQLAADDEEILLLVG